MTKNSGITVRLGIFISLGLALLILGVYLIGERQQLFRRTFRVTGVFKDVAGLQVGDNVRLSGINVGTVDDITIVSDTSVSVGILISESTRQFVKKDALASIGSEGLMGNKTLIISPGSGGKMEIEDRDTIATVQPVNVDDLMVSLKTTLDNTSNITRDLSKITNRIQSGRGTIGRLLMDQSDAQKFDSTLANVKESSAEFRVFMAKAKKSWLMWGF